LIKHDVIRQLGGVRPEFETLLGAGLELGHRYLTRGAFVRHDPALVAQAAPTSDAALPLHDEILFGRLCYGDFWARWGLGRAILAGDFRARELAKARTAFVPVPSTPPAFQRADRRIDLPANVRVSVILPTIERYPYLRQLLPQLAAQTYPVHEILIIDQTPLATRETEIAAEFPDLPLRVDYQEQPGQCTARNHAITLATGELLLFLDDDDEVDPDVVEKHLRCLTEFGVDVSCGVVEEVGAGPVPEYQRFIRASDVFPTNNTMIRREVLRKSGMFDLAYDCKQSEDGDLGMRVHLAGVMMVLDPRISVLHHRAPRGGLRTHGTRVVTYVSSRAQIRHRNLPHMSEVYLGMRYFTERQVAEMLALRKWSTLRLKGSAFRQGLKVAYGLASLPDTIHRLSLAERGARRMATHIEPLPPRDQNERHGEDLD
jgi:glycosyltransferase involved in cell wall biosynthesis